MSKARYILPISILNTLFCAFCVTPLFAYEGGGNGSTTVTTTCEAPNAFTGLCGNPAGSLGGGASWHLYSTTNGENISQNVRPPSKLLDGYTTSTSDILSNCSTEQWYVAYGWDDTNSGRGGSSVWGPIRWGEDTAYNSYNAKSFSYIQQNGLQNNTRLTSDAALEFYKRLHPGASSIPTNTGYFCMDPAALSNFKTSVEATISSNPVVYQGESFNINGKVTVSPENSSVNATGTPNDTIMQIFAFTTDTENPSYKNESWDRPSLDLENYVSGVTKKSIKKVTLSGPISSSKSQSYSIAISPEDSAIGDRVCVAVGVKPSRSSGGRAQYTWNITTTCRTIAKKPSVNILGNLFASGTLSGALASKTDGLTYGSWAQYLTVANGKIANFASGSTISHGNSDINSLFPLTISNNDKNNLGSAKVIPPSTFKNDIKNYCTENGDTINISENITDFKIICAKNINISPNVEKIDAWLVADDAINTCAGVDNENLYKKCNDTKLTINGLVYAKNLILNRTYGAGEGSTNYYDTAETINLNYNDYSYTYEHTHSGDPETTRLHDVYTKELLPRL